MQIKPLVAVNINDISWEDTRFDDIHIKLLSFRDGVIFEIASCDISWRASLSSMACAIVLARSLIFRRGSHMR